MGTPHRILGPAALKWAHGRLRLQGRAAHDPGPARPVDEPFSKLDTALSEDFRRLVFAHARTRGLPTILVTHDEADARAAGGTVLRLATE
jgi:ABC-type uncharacterized transport system YnjBCD ATPase subunit